MANKNITMKQYNGTDYDNLYPQTEWDNVLNKPYIPSQSDFADTNLSNVSNTWISNPNLLDNWYFKNPVNQRGVSGSISSAGYFIDRWKLISGSVEIVNNGLLLNGTISQILENGVGTNVKATYLISNGGVANATYNDGNKTFTITGNGVVIVAAKLELGSIQTLAHQFGSSWVVNEIPNIVEETLKCQRYFINFNPSYIIGGYTTSSSSRYRMTIPLPTNLRATPSIVGTVTLTCRFFKSDSTTSGQTPPNGSYSVWFPSSGASPELWEVGYNGSNAIKISAGVTPTTSKRDPNNIPFAMVLNNLAFSADL